MKTYILEGIVTALSSITHNGGERNGIVIQLRREKFVQPTGKAVEVPVISGNSVRGIFRDISAKEILQTPEGNLVAVDAASFNFLFSGGSLESTGGNDLKIDKIRQLRKDIPMVSVLGGSVGNVILPGKVNIGKLIPICKETAHLIPEKYHGEGELRTVWEYCQEEMYTRKDDSKDENLREYMNEEARAGEGKKKLQMMYHTETLAAGTRFFWRICLMDTTDKETGAFLHTMQKWTELSSQIGGNGRVGHGAVRVELKETQVLDSELDFHNEDFVRFIGEYENNKADVGKYFEKKSIAEALK